MKIVRIRNKERETYGLIQDGKIAEFDNVTEGAVIEDTLDARGLIVCPGLVDLQARLREPGEEHKANFDTELAAAVAGGVTTICCPPDTDPVIDTPAMVQMIRHRAEETGLTRVLPVGALTRS